MNEFMSEYEKILQIHSKKRKECKFCSCFYNCMANFHFFCWISMHTDTINKKTNFVHSLKHSSCFIVAPFQSPIAFFIILLLALSQHSVWNSFHEVNVHERKYTNTLDALFNKLYLCLFRFFSITFTTILLAFDTFRIL